MNGIKTQGAEEEEKKLKHQSANDHVDQILSPEGVSDVNRDKDGTQRRNQMKVQEDLSWA